MPGIHDIRSLPLRLFLCTSVLAVPAGALEVNDKTVILPAAPEHCALLDDPQRVRTMDGLLLNLVWSCGRLDLLGGTPLSPSAARSCRRPGTTAVSTPATSCKTPSVGSRSTAA
jgi:hypothetical protein